MLSFSSCSSILSCSAFFSGIFPPVTASWQCFLSSSLNPLLSLYCLLKPPGIQFQTFNPQLDADRMQISILRWRISPQNPRPIFPISYYISSPECAARNSDSIFPASNSITTPDVFKNFLLWADSYEASDLETHIFLIECLFIL